MSPRFEEVPEHWKHPFGPYRRAPGECGGEWWLVSPFTTAEPWVLAAGSTGPPERLPEGFMAIFGERPKARDFLGGANPSLLFRTAVGRWEQDLRYFRRAGLPEWAEPGQAEAAGELFRRWGMGAPRFYEGRYDWMARFPESEAPDFESAAWAALFATHLVIAQYQLALIERDVTPPQQHPFVPPHMWPNGEESKKEV